MYYNTTGLTNDQLKERWRKASNQDDRVYLVFLYLREATASQAHERYCMAKKFKETPITSIRRSINTLCKNGVLVKTTRKIKGPYGDPEHIFKLNDDAQ